MAVLVPMTCLEIGVSWHVTGTAGWAAGDRLLGVRAVTDVPCATTS
jgi:hypothetical protein